MKYPLLISAVILPIAAIAASGEVNGQTAKRSAAEGRAYAEALANPASWNGNWFSPYGAAISDKPRFLVENGPIYELKPNGVDRSKRVENIRFNRTYREGLGLVHEFSVTCIFQFSSPSVGTLTVKSDFRGPYGDAKTAWVEAWPTISGCNGLVLGRRKGPQFSPLPYPSV